MKTVMVMNMLIKKLLMFLSAHRVEFFSCWDGQKRVAMLPSELSMFIPKVSTYCRAAPRPRGGDYECYNIQDIIKKVFSPL